MLPVGIFIPSAGRTTHQDGEPTTIQVRIYAAEKPELTKVNFGKACRGA